LSCSLIRRIRSGAGRQRLRGFFTKLSEYAIPEIKRQRYHRDDNSCDDELRGYLCVSAPDSVKHNPVYDGNDHSTEDNGSQKGVVWKNDFTNQRLTSPTSVLIGSTATTLVRYSSILHKPLMNVLMVKNIAAVIASAPALFTHMPSHTRAVGAFAPVFA
jgi:hypothetical protein